MALFLSILSVVGFPVALALLFAIVRLAHDIFVLRRPMRESGVRLAEGLYVSGAGLLFFIGLMVAALAIGAGAAAAIYFLVMML